MTRWWSWLPPHFIFVSAFGRWRAFVSLDELPQKFRQLKSQMCRIARANWIALKLLTVEQLGDPSRARPSRSMRSRTGGRAGHVCGPNVTRWLNAPFRTAFSFDAIKTTRAMKGHGPAWTGAWTAGPCGATTQVGEVRGPALQVRCMWKVPTTTAPKEGVGFPGVAFLNFGANPWSTKRSKSNARSAWWCFGSGASGFALAIRCNVRTASSCWPSTAAQVTTIFGGRSRALWALMEEARQAARDHAVAGSPPLKR